MTAGKTSIKVRQFFTNRLLNRKQFVVDILHPGQPSLSSAQLKEKLAEQFKVANPQTIMLTGFKTKFGGGKSSGFANIYDSIQDIKLVEAKHKLARNKLITLKKDGRRLKKEKKNRAAAVRGKEKTKVKGANKK
ncbi:predicted protein [Naegleria gruberi]|uniref:40S ribosomal protein S24 n=1 Tax=Naegleria gruberi TaxID=5762 RepID=D2V7Z8_NAEGR|nr:uncharacterized protein NAEGRDRAFT_64979 [Naegleria gruberi]EFC46954.1 predicted protein [Naegleria gruberi]|eukprot:XP_002679698.1 predicted protein [Naegleria gruberi strain NEG-M]